MPLDEALEQYLTENHFFEGMFDALRLVDLGGICVCKRDGDGSFVLTHEPCFTFWSRHQNCANCVTREQQRGESLYLALWDLDRFKRINDTYGHDAGDEVLLGISDALRKGLTKDDCFAARFGGDEFAILFRLQDRDACRAKLAAIQQDIATRAFHAHDGEIFHVTASFGLSDVSKEPDSTCAIHPPRRRPPLPPQADCARECLTIQKNRKRNLLPIACNRFLFSVSRFVFR
ncbi:MAG: GGDEF domain-containing protein [Selenomonadaceae bacterium]|nr:GGDEF domain-containing protein [Selenomonadaceae bacterium]